MFGLFFRLLIWGAIFAAGFTAAQAWERRPYPEKPGLAERFLGKGLKAQLLEAQDRASKAEGAVGGWRARAESCEGQREDAADRQAGQISEGSARTDTRAGAAFDLGYRAGRQAGARSCGTSPDATPSPDAGPAVPADGLRDDLAAVFNASLYQPAP